MSKMFLVSVSSHRHLASALTRGQSRHVQSKASLKQQEITDDTLLPNYSVTHRVEIDELGDASHAHDGDGLVHAAGLGAHIPLACARKLCNFLHKLKERQLGGWSLANEDAA